MAWGNPFFDPNSAYGGTTWGPGEFADTGVGGIYFDQNPEAAWTRYTAARGVDPLTQQGQFNRALFPQVLEGYKAALATNPMLRINDYIQGIDPQALFNMQSADQRGESPGKYAPRTRTISRGY